MKTIPIESNNVSGLTDSGIAVKNKQALTLHIKEQPSLYITGKLPYTLEFMLHILESSVSWTGLVTAF